MSAKRWSGRRPFLMGLGGATLALPPLVSLMTKEAAAQVTAQPRLILFPMEYGMHTRYLRPSDEALAPHLRRIDDHIHAANLVDIEGPMSFVLDASYDELRPHMNVFRGLDARTGHSHGMFCASGAGIEADNTNRKPTYGKSIDVVVEQSAAFRAGFSGARPTLRLTSGRPKPMSWDREPGAVFPTARHGIRGDRAAAEAVLAGIGPVDDSALQRERERNGRRARVIDLVREDLQALERHPRLSAGDRTMVDRMVSSVNDVQRRLETPDAAAACEAPALEFASDEDGALVEGGSFRRMHENFADLITTSFVCNLSRMAFITNNKGTDSGGTIGHHDFDNIENDGTDRQKWAIDGMLRTLALQLKNTPDPFAEGSLLDNSLIIMLNEHSGRRGHGARDLPVLTFGGLGGSINVGQYIDFRQDGQDYGHPAKMLLQSAMLGMGVTQDEYRAVGDGDGFGQRPSDELSRFASTHNEPLPFFTR